MCCPKVGTRHPFVAVRCPFLAMLCPFPAMRCPFLAMRQVFGPHRFEGGAMPDPFGAIRCLFEPMPNPFGAVRCLFEPMPNPFGAIRCLFESMPNPFAAMPYVKGDASSVVRIATPRMGSDAEIEGRNVLPEGGHAVLVRWETPRLWRGGIRSLTVPGVFERESPS
jgi:hypothetical protein